MTPELLAHIQSLLPTGKLLLIASAYAIWSANGKAARNYQRICYLVFQWKSCYAYTIGYDNVIASAHAIWSSYEQLLCNTVLGATS